ncbi:SDR1 [Symbiodinium sp. CCMP2592]|nr:SDR1 [Symbiodinium sp. CCMP2592]
MAAYSFLRFRKATPREGEDEDDEKEASTSAAQSFKTVEVDGREVTLRVFTPAGGGGSKPAVVMVCGLLWFGEGILGFIGLNFNDAFGHALARNGLPCVQIHTPQRHIAHTRVQELALALCAPVYLVPGLRFLLLAADVLMLLTSQRDIWLLLVVVVLPGLMDAVLATSLAVPMLLLGPLGWLITALNMIGGLVLVPALHFAFRTGQYLMGELDLSGEGRRDYLKEVEAAVSWAEENAKALKSDGRLVLCGYSSGGHVAALYGLEHCAAAKKGRGRFEAVVLVSGIYDLRTNWKDARRFLAPVMNLIFKVGR